MPVVKLGDLDQLYSILLDLEVFAYLQGLLQFDSDGTSVVEHNFKSTHRHAESYLWEKEFESVQKLSTLLNKEDFCE